MVGDCRWVPPQPGDDDARSMGLLPGRANFSIHAARHTHVIPGRCTGAPLASWQVSPDRFFWETCDEYGFLAPIPDRVGTLATVAFLSGTGATMFEVRDPHKGWYHYFDFKYLTYYTTETQSQTPAAESEFQKDVRLVERGNPRPNMDPPYPAPLHMVLRSIRHPHKEFPLTTHDNCALLQSANRGDAWIRAWDTTFDETVEIDWRRGLLTIATYRRPPADSDSDAEVWEISFVPRPWLRRDIDTMGFGENARRPRRGAAPAS